jgi:hypothetical protein
MSEGKQNMKSEYDPIIIGAGHNGLSTLSTG